MVFDRRQFLGGVGALAFGTASAGQDAAGTLTIGAAWRGPANNDSHHLGVLEVDWSARSVRIKHALSVPSRPHGLLAEADGSLLAVALRPGRWLMRVDCGGGAAASAAPDESSRTTFGGHVAASRDGRWLYTTETRTADGRGCVGIRDARTLRKIDEWSTHGIEPHQLLVDAQDNLLIANGGIHRDADDHKRALDRMDSSLVRLHGASGALLGQWRLSDARLSIRHMALSEPAEGNPALLGLALQAEHDDAARRAEAPALAIWDGTGFELPAHQAVAAGYAGDIATTGDGGFVISNAFAHRTWLWRPDQPDALTEVAQLQRAYALAPWQAGGVIIAAGRGIGRWHPAQPPALVPWPAPMALDNHWVTWEGGVRTARDPRQIISPSCLSSGRGRSPA